MKDYRYLPSNIIGASVGVVLSAGVDTSKVAGKGKVASESEGKSQSESAGKVAGKGGVEVGVRDEVRDEVESEVAGKGAVAGKSEVRGAGEDNFLAQQTDEPSSDPLCWATSYFKLPSGQLRRGGHSGTQFGFNGEG